MENCSKQIELLNSSYFFISLFDNSNSCSINELKSKITLNYVFIASAGAEGVFFILKLLIFIFYFLINKEFILIIKTIFNFLSLFFSCDRENKQKILCGKTYKVWREFYSYFKRLYTYTFYSYKNIFVEIIINVSFTVYEFFILYTSILISVNKSLEFKSFPFFWSFLSSFVIQILISMFYINTIIWYYFGAFFILIGPLSLNFTRKIIEGYTFSLIYHSILLVLNVFSLWKILKYNNKENTLKIILKERENKKEYPLNIKLNTIENKLYQNNTIKNIYCSFSSNNLYYIKSRYSLKYILIVCFALLIIAKGTIIGFAISYLVLSIDKYWLIYPLFGDICLVNLVAWLSFTKIEINKIMLI